MVLIEFKRSIKIYFKNLCLASKINLYLIIQHAVVMRTWL